MGCQADEGSHGILTFEFTDALGLESDSYFEADGSEGYGNGDGNGYVSLNEAYLYAENYLKERYDYYGETPIKSDPYDIGKDTYFGEINFEAMGL